MSIELAIMMTVLLFMVGASVTIYYNRITLVAGVLFLLVTSMITWMTLATLSDNSAVEDVTYHEIVRQKLPNGEEADFFIVTDHRGRPVVAQIMEPVEKPEKYKVARVRYSKKSMGLNFKSWSDYQVVPKD